MVDCPPSKDNRLAVSGSSPDKRGGLSRRDVFLGAAGGFYVLSRRSGALADEAERHGMSAFGDLGYPADFPFFKYVNPNAPKGGVYSETVSSRGYNGSFLTF